MPQVGRNEGRAECRGEAGGTAPGQRPGSTLGGQPLRAAESPGGQLAEVHRRVRDRG